VEKEGLHLLPTGADPALEQVGRGPGRSVGAIAHPAPQAGAWGLTDGHSGFQASLFTSVGSPATGQDFCYCFVFFKLLGFFCFVFLFFFLQKE
jgi:hypothetical protein